MKIADALSRCHDIETEWDEELEAELAQAGETPQRESKFEGIWLGPWQKQSVIHIGENPFSGLQEPRQLGKTYAVCLWAVAYLGAGYRVILAMPTMTQGSRIIFLQVKQMLARLAVVEAFRELLPTKGDGNADNLNELQLPNGGRMLVRSADPDANNEGYTCELVIMDEAQEYGLKVLAVFQFFTRYAMRKGIGRVVLTGIGGPRQSCIEAVKHQPEVEGAARYHVFRVDGDELIPYLETHFPEMETTTTRLRKEFRDALATLGQAEYNVHIRCMEVRSGHLTIFQNLPLWVPFDNRRLRPKIEFAHDVGNNPDSTTVLAVKTAGLQANIVARLKIQRMDYEIQAKVAAEWMRAEIAKAPECYFLSRSTRVERNYAAKYLAALKEEYPFGDSYGIFTSDKKPSFYKSNWIERLMERDTSGNLGCSVPEVRDELLGLTYDRATTGRYDWPHSDALSALWIWEAGTISPFGV